MIYYSGRDDNQLVTNVRGQLPRNIEGMSRD